MVKDEDYLGYAQRKRAFVIHRSPLVLRLGYTTPDLYS